MQETRNSCLDSKKRNTILRQVKTGKHECHCFHLTKEHCYLLFIPRMRILLDKILTVGKNVLECRLIVVNEKLFFLKANDLSFLPFLLKELALYISLMLFRNVP